ncbi:hypothetical protein [uncultured Subdoligranulum sp.]|uniref:hypothetical protein n=1 Tax=uncultured Subdoligranulum sp. TaxID=512298 RepID=UPI00261EE200|nr:hypothetical protein [uncultured Subdoligranulum sp.]
MVLLEQAGKIPKKGGKRRGVSVKRQTVFSRKTVYTTNVKEKEKDPQNGAMKIVQADYWTE